MTRARPASASSGHRRQGAGGAEQDTGPSPNADQLARIVARAGAALVQVSLPAFRRAIGDWVDAHPEPDGQVAAGVAAVLGAAIAPAWTRGWQPADLARAAARLTSARHAALVTAAIGDEARSFVTRHELTMLHPSWQAQLEDLGALPMPAGAPPPLVARWQHRQRVPDDELVVLAFEAGCRLYLLPALPVLIPPPGQGPEAVDERVRGSGARDAAHGPGQGVDRKLFEKVRALLAKAESTTFPEEADALTMKAQELMARHSIDAAMFQATHTRPGTGPAPSARRVPIDDPYASAKSQLLAEIADANRSTAVWTKALGFATVFGFDVDLDIVEVLYTSLLVQATGAVVAAGAQVDARGRSRTRSFRQSFLFSFAVRIGERLHEAAHEATEAADREFGAALVPVLADQAAAVAQAQQAIFPRVTRRRASVSNASGWAAGRTAADLADLGAATPIDPG